VGYGNKRASVIAESRKSYLLSSVRISTRQLAFPESSFDVRLEPTRPETCIRPMNKFDWTQFVYGV